MILSNKEIKKYVQDTKTLLIEPFIEEHLQAASYDISMSGNIVVLKLVCVHLAGDRKGLTDYAA